MGSASKRIKASFQNGRPALLVPSVTGIAAKASWAALAEAGFVTYSY